MLQTKNGSEVWFFQGADGVKGHENSSERKKEVIMQEIKLETNELGLKVFINGVPDISLMPEETWEGLLRRWSGK